ncbi:MAG: hypothetical protein IT338_18720 [Thermomicrobiales bacterium]|nr:hypothetical protein [Thermomicrobiales bacterium]
MTTTNEQPAGLAPAPDNDEQRLPEPAASDEPAREAPGPSAPPLLMFNAGGEGACTDDGCIVTFPVEKKG